MNSIIKIENVTKKFDAVVALNNLSLEIKKGEMFGFVGPDGAGKTTTIRLMCGIYKPDNGKVSILGYDSIKESHKIKNKIGYLSQKFSLYGDLSIDENIEFFAEIHGVREYKKRRDELLEFTRLTPFRKRYAENLSGGMKQKLALACTLIHTPDILFLDEPTTGVDPVSRRDFWKILSDVQKQGITIFITTPYLDEAERCNRVGLINKGSMMNVDNPQELKKIIKTPILEIVPDNVRKSSKLLKECGIFEDIQTFGDRICLILNDKITNVEKLLKIPELSGLKIKSSRIIPPTLENVFIGLLRNSSKDSNSR
jgi:ABC-2 type transport system ATP-binding protein